MTQRPAATDEDMEKLQTVLPQLMGFYQEHNLFEEDDKRYFSSMRSAALKGAFGSHALAMSAAYLGLKRLPSVRAPMPMSMLIGLLAVPIGSAYFVRPLVPEALYLDTSFGAEAREKFRSEHPRSALLRGTGHMRTLDQMARNRADENTRERGRLGSRQPQVEPDNYPPPKLDDSYFFSATDFEGYNAHGDHHEADAAPDSFDSDSRHSAHAYDHRDDDDEQQYADAWVVEDGVNDDVPVVNATPHPGYESSAYGRDRYEDERDQRRRTPKQRTRTWDEIRREAAMNGK